MNNLAVMAAGIGARDGLNPCVFMAAAIFIALGEWLKGRFLHISRLRALFVFVYLFSFIAVTFGPGQFLVTQKNFIWFAKLVYFSLGVWAFVSGLLYLKDWYRIRRGMPAKEEAPQKLGAVAATLVYWLTVTAAVGLSLLSSIWPLDKYVVVLGNGALLKGQWDRVWPMLTSYSLSSMWAFWMAWLFLGIKNIRPSFFKIICSAVFFTASTCMILLFK